MSFRNSSLRVATLMAAAAFAAAPAMRAQQADMILHNGKVLTVDANFSVAQAVAVQGNKIAAVGTDAAVLAMKGPNTKVIDLKGRTLIPGLIDTHMHIHDYAEGTYGAAMTPQENHRYPVDWKGVKSKQDVINQVKGLMDKYKFPKGKWVYFENQLSFTGGGGNAEHAKILYDDMSRYDLDKIAPDNPIAMSMGIPDFNGFLLNSMAIDIIWNKKGYADFITKYGRFWIDQSGRPDGHLEPPASRLLGEYVLDREPAVFAPYYKKYNEELAAAGLTTISTRVPQEALKTYQLLASKGEMTFRLGYGREEVFGTVKNPATELAQFKGLVGSGDDKFWVTSVAPTAVDGASTRACTNQKRVTSYGAIDGWWPLGQCHTDTEFSGSPRRSSKISGNYFQEWTMAQGKYGIRFANTHVAGDRSVATLLRMVEDIQKRDGVAATKGWQFDHCFLVNVKDLPKAKQLGVGFSCAPKYVESAPSVATAYGDEVANNFMVPVKSMIKNGVHMAFESDRDVYTWYDLEIMLTRKDRKGKVWGPQEALTKQEALQSITRWAAEYVLKADKIGSIEKGKLADLVVLDKDYMTIPDDQVSEMRPQMTMMDGKVIFIATPFSQEQNLKPAGATISTYDELLKRRPEGERPDF
jgi:predicted amidohydrolase YtcJ